MTNMIGSSTDDMSDIRIPEILLLTPVGDVATTQSMIQCVHPKIYVPVGTTITI